MPLSLSKTNGCCAMYEVSNLSSHKDEEDALRAIVQRAESVLEQGDERIAFISFTGVVSNAGTYHTDRKDDYGNALEELITENELGDVVSTKPRASWTRNTIKAWVWAPDWPKVRAWYGRKVQTQQVPSATGTVGDITRNHQQAWQAPPVGQAAGLPQGAGQTAAERRRADALQALRDRIARNHANAAANVRQGGERVARTDDEQRSLDDYNRRRANGDFRVLDPGALPGVRSYRWNTDGTAAPGETQVNQWRVRGWTRR